MDGVALENGTDFRYGYVPTEAGYDLVVWLKALTIQKTELLISR
jgi:hypothetical protein